MMRHDEEPQDEPLLFDLPLEPERGRSAAAPSAPVSERKRAPRAAPPGPRQPVIPEPDLAFDEPDEELPSDRTGTARKAGRTGRAGLGSRISAAGADLVVHAAVAVGVLVGCRLMGVHPVLSDWPAVALFLMSFSFLYTVVPLAFWGHTPGMAWVGLDARSRDGEPLAFDQTARRWIGGLLTLLLLGLPLLLAFSGRSLSDLLSGSETLSGRPAA
ncbi:MAG: RDD family protein [Thermoanaerobaculia bacterium]